MVEAIAIAAVSVFFVGIGVGLVTTEVLGNALKRPDTPGTPAAPRRQYKRKTARR